LKLIYLACPYTAPTLQEMKARVAEATKAAAALMLDGYNVFSPLTHSDPIADVLGEDNRLNHSFWLLRDFQILERCDELHVLKLPGWDTSYGVKLEILKAHDCGIPVFYIEV